MAKMNFGGVEENVVTREEFTLEMARKAIGDRTIAVIGYGVQGPGQALNLRENGHTPSEAFNETVEELTQSLMPLFAAKGMEKELKALRESEMWRTAETVRQLRPENNK